MRRQGREGPALEGGHDSGDRDVLSVDEAARYLGVDRKLVYRGALRGEIPHARLGRRLLLSRRALEDWVAGKLINPASR